MYSTTKYLRIGNRSLLKFAVCGGCSPSPSLADVRCLSTRDIFLRDLPARLAELVPEAPVPIYKPSLEEMLSNGQSVLDELGLWTWWKPSSWMRWVMEYAHLTLDIPWWGTIIATTVTLRLLFFPIPVNMRRMMALHQKYAPELKEFTDKMQKASREGNNALSMQIMWEQRDFMNQKGIKMMKNLPLMLANGAVFMTMFCALKKLANSKYPGFQDGGVFWFPDLTVGDPYWLLPLFAATSLHFVFRAGIETGSLLQMPKMVKYAMLFGFPLLILVSANQFTSAVCLYWCTSNTITLAFALLFRSARVQRLLKLPPPLAKELRQVPKMRLSAMREDWQQARASAAPPSLATLKKKDLEQFKRAGRGKPIIVDETTKK
ncbi:hypothetical protein niasHT_018848 [Heterodera trifolii]|uniref:Membrane insertase YidC/Oxa/ALB C-terminal domain-containing protein n=1 Tax=Heterodera trifolii TaxID=157864 RepID=A0ABD2KYK4_9BILA